MPQPQPLGNSPPAQVTQLDDGSMEFDWAPPPLPTVLDEDHDANLVDKIEDTDLNRISTSLLEAVQADLDSRKDWEDIYIAGIDLLGLKLEDRTEPFQGAANVHHPLLLEAVIRFQANARGEMLPAAGPVKTQIIGGFDEARVATAQRVQDAMNFYLTETAGEYYPDFDQMLLYLPICGSTFKKTYWCPIRKRPVSPFIMPDDIIVAYTATSLQEAHRVTHRTFPTRNDVIRFQLANYYAPTTLRSPAQGDTNLRSAIADIEGRTPITVDGLDDVYCHYEIHQRMDIPDLRPAGAPAGLPLPYVWTIDRESGEVLRIARDWDKNDKEFKPRESLAHYQFLPGLGFYGLSLTHLLGNTARAATSALRQLLDAGTWSNLPAGFVVKGLKIEDSDIALSPGEWREIATNGMPIADAFSALPFKEPSQVLMALLEQMASDAQRLAGVSDIAVGEGNEEAPVGTTVALIDQATKLISSVHKRLHQSHRSELRMLRKLFAEAPEAIWPSPGKAPGNAATGSDFADGIDVIPVSDPNIPTQVQRTMRAQALLQLAQTNPGVYDLRAVNEVMLLELNIPAEKVLNPPPQQAQPQDPVSENISALTSKPLAAGANQNHAAHIAVHQGFLMQNQGNPAVASSLQAHIAEHQGMMYRQQIEQKMGQPLPPGPLPPQQEFQISQQMAQAAQNLPPPPGMEGQNQAAQQALQLKQQELQIQQQELQQKNVDEQRKAQQALIQNQQEQTKQDADIQNSREDRASRERLAEMKLQSEHLRNQHEEHLASAGIHPGGGLPPPAQP